MVRGLKKSAIAGTMVKENENPSSYLNDHVISFPYKQNNIYFNRSLLSTHLLLIGAIGTGKTNVIHKVMKDIQHLDNRSFAMIFDTKGDFYRYYDSSKDILISTGKKYRFDTNYYNIFKEIRAYSDDKEEQRTFIREIAKSYFADRRNESQPFFSNAAEQLFANILIGFNEGLFEIDNHSYKTKNDIFDISKKKELSNEIIWNFFQNYSDEQIAGILRKHHFRNTESAVGDASSRQALGVFGELRSMIQDYFPDAFHYSDTRKDVSIIETVRKKNGVKIFIEYDLTKGQILSPVYSLLFDLALKEALGRSKSEGDCYFIIDELKLLPKLNHLEDGLNYGRSLGVKCLCGIQNIHQIKETYGEDGAKSLLSGFMNIFNFYVLDYETRHYIIDNLGTNYLDYYYYTEKEKPVNIQKEGHIVEDDDILSLNRGQAIVKINGLNPFIYQFGKYDD
ncbi:MAG: type IV secretion system DNA-binding domain-containing protein [Erysipelotrichaceae bacterium]|nr:type IV secretion system DNA-binding domain-containing protein [Erysipelotrichaceae bacterium]